MGLVHARPAPDRRQAGPLLTPHGVGSPERGQAGDPDRPPPDPSWGWFTQCAGRPHGANLHLLTPHGVGSPDRAAGTSPAGPPPDPSWGWFTLGNRHRHRHHAVLLTPHGVGSLSWSPLISSAREIRPGPGPALELEPLLTPHGVGSPSVVSPAGSDTSCDARAVKVGADHLLTPHGVGSHGPVPVLRWNSNRS
jgi:hypothetical protein